MIGSIVDPFDLMPGLDFASKHALTVKELQTLTPLLSKDYSTMDLAIHLGIKKKALHHTISRLKLKGLVVVKEKDGATLIYRFNRMVG